MLKVDCLRAGPWNNQTKKSTIDSNSCGNANKLTHSPLRATALWSLGTSNCIPLKADLFWRNLCEK